LTINFGFAGPSERPIAADFNADGVDDIGLFVTQHGGVTPSDAAEWFILISTGTPIPGTVNTLAHAFEPAPFGNDFYANFGNAAGQPLVGNFDPPTNSAAIITDPHHNPLDPLDVDNDGYVSASDALTIINVINGSGPGEVVASSVQTAPFVDVNGDGYVSAGDALLVINHINAQSGADQAEGESSAADSYFNAVGSDSDASADELWDLLAFDTSTPNGKRR
jgi:hypothetical protein